MLLINELSKRTGIAVPTIRYYETLGLIKGEADEKIKTNNYKYYDDHVIERLEIIAEAKEVGFTLAEIRNFLEGWFGSNSSRSEQIKIFVSKIEEIDAKIKQLKQIRKKLDRVIKELGNNEC